MTIRGAFGVGMVVGIWTAIAAQAAGITGWPRTFYMLVAAFGAVSAAREWGI